MSSDDEKVNALKKLIEKLPPVNRSIIRSLAFHLDKVAAASTNSMNVNSLAECLGPSYAIILPPIITLANKVFS